jgi:hypothetical protein
MTSHMRVLYSDWYLIKFDIMKKIIQMIPMEEPEKQQLMEKLELL